MNRAKVRPGESGMVVQVGESADLGGTEQQRNEVAQVGGGRRHRGLAEDRIATYDATERDEAPREGCRLEVGHAIADEDDPVALRRRLKRPEDRHLPASAHEWRPIIESCVATVGIEGDVDRMDLVDPEMLPKVPDGWQQPAGDDHDPFPERTERRHQLSRR